MPARRRRLRGSEAVRCLVIIALFCVTGGTARANEPEYLVEYRAYSDAIERGDAAAAQRHASAAWQASEEARGDDKLTAILAFNFAQQALFSARAEAIVAIRRADELRELAAGSLPEKKLDLYLAYLELVTGENSRRNSNALREALDAVGDNGADLTFELATITMGLAIRDLAAERLRDAVVSATAAQAAVRRADPTDNENLAMAGIIKGAAMMLQQPRRAARIREAQTEFREVRDLYPPQKDIESFDAGLARVLAWEVAANALLQAMGTRTTQLWDERDTLFENTGGPTAECGLIDWASRSEPEFPRDALYEGYVGAVLVGYHIGDDFDIEGARVLAEVPASRLGDAALDAVATWKVASMENDAPECRRNQLTRFRYVID